MTTNCELRKIYIKDDKKYFAKEYVKNISKNRQEKSSIILEDLDEKKTVVIPLEEFRSEFILKNDKKEK